MTGKMTFLNVFDERINLEEGMIVFVPADDLLWDKIVAADGNHRIEINSIKHIVGPIAGLKEFRANPVNENAKILVVEFGADILPIHHDDAYLAIGNEDNKIVEFDPVDSLMGPSALIA